MKIKAILAGVGAALVLAVGVAGLSGTASAEPKQPTAVPSAAPAEERPTDQPSAAPAGERPTVRPSAAPAEARPTAAPQEPAVVKPAYTG